MQRFSWLALILFLGSLGVHAQQITCLDTVTSSGFFFLVRAPTAAGQAPCESGALCRPYYVPDEYRLNLDVIFYQARHVRNDSVKYLAYTPALEGQYLRSKMSAECANYYEQGISLESTIKPARFFKVKSKYPAKRTYEVGLVKVRATWMHLRMVDRVAFDYFNEPYSLGTPYKISKLYDVFIPIKLLSINRDTSIDKKRFIVR